MLTLTPGDLTCPITGPWTGGRIRRAVLKTEWNDKGEEVTREVWEEDGVEVAPPQALAAPEIPPPAALTAPAAASIGKKSAEGGKPAAAGGVKPAAKGTGKGKGAPASGQSSISSFFKKG